MKAGSRWGAGLKVYRGWKDGGMGGKKDGKIYEGWVDGRIERYKRDGWMGG